MPFGWLHDPLVAIAKLGTVAFFSRIHIEGIDEVPPEGDGPFLALANHWNSAVDVSLSPRSCYLARASLAGGRLGSSRVAGRRTSPCRPRGSRTGEGVDSAHGHS